MLEAIVHGLILSFGLILPLGAQNIFIFNQGVTQHSFRAALPVVITASVCDAILIALAVAGLSVIVLQFTWMNQLLLAIGCLFLLYMGWSIWKSVPDDSKEEPSGPISPRQQILFAVSVSLFNPHAIIDTIGVVGTSSLAYQGIDKLLFAGACVAVSFIWFFMLAAAGRKLGHYDKDGRKIRKLNQASALFMWGMAVFLAYQLFRQL
ncbi:LysE/ArgO family amino acid transporter [Halalkalibacter oceani]|uniref:LysE/ArgO family amino acid transporter n=1 Tax=Halalkalibacter oceani TaxID=1653776 RepID=A0A9X2DRY7_9BACI|nr:LysE/ArgO family amino acid transporter [Halalkalibacter oceani]MCM3715337.1 LysE/ArgO family amino acid transporter [Halalkalibacter oceani]